MGCSSKRITIDDNDILKCSTRNKGKSVCWEVDKITED